MAKPRVLISDSMSSLAAAVFEERGLEVVSSSKLSPEELKDTIGDFDGLAMRSSTTVTPELLESATRLKVVGRAGIGVDNVELGTFRKPAHQPMPASGRNPSLWGWNSLENY